MIHKCKWQCTGSMKVALTHLQPMIFNTQTTLLSVYLQLVVGGKLETGRWALLANLDGVVSEPRQLLTVHHTHHASHQRPSNRGLNSASPYQPPGSRSQRLLDNVPLFPVERNYHRFLPASERGEKTTNRGGWRSSLPSGWSSLFSLFSKSSEIATMMSFELAARSGQRYYSIVSLVCVIFCTGDGGRTCQKTAAVVFLDCFRQKHAENYYNHSVP